MMQFRFQLEGLLRVRYLLERQARERLDESMMRVRSLERSLAEATEWSRKTAGIRSSQNRVPAGEMQFIESVLRQTQAAIAHCQGQKQDADERAAELRARYLLARRERKTVSTLRENALRQFQAEQARRQQSELDEMFLGKLLRSRKGAQQALADAKPKRTP
jgi:flagellar export protein FliJ